MTSVLLRLGDFKFSVATAAYDSFKRRWQWLWPTQARFRKEPSHQYTGPGAQTIQLSGTVYLGNIGKPSSLDDIVAQANKGEPLLLVAGTGDVLGLWVVVSVTKDDSLFFGDGQARRSQFTVDLSFYGDLNG